MTWVRLDDCHQDHPKIAPLSDRAYRLWVRSISHSNRYGLNGDLTASVLRQICIPIGAKKRHQTELIVAGLWRKTDAGVAVHDIDEYQPTARKSAELSAKRSEAGKRGAAARWQTDGNLPMATDAPVPSRPDPSDRESKGRGFDASITPGKFGDQDAIDAQSVEIHGGGKFGILAASTEGGALAVACPIYGHELRAMLASPGKSWGYALKVLRTYREKAADDSMPKGSKERKRDPSVGYHPGNSREYFDTPEGRKAPWEI